MTRRPPIPITPVEHAASEAHRHAHDHDISLHDAQGIDRRSFLKLMAASAALASAGCSGPPIEKIVPYIDMPELLVSGKPLYYASAFVRHGYAQGVLIESNMGRPTKIEGNPRHPASLGATDIFAQASVLQLWDPDRSQAVYHGDTLSTWEALKTALLAPMAGWSKNGGDGLRILTGSVTSPTLAAQIAQLLQRYPNARWHSYDPLHDDAASDAAMLAFGRAVDILCRFDRAAVVFSADADFLGEGPGSTRYARDFVRQRRSDNPQFSNRLYAAHASPTLTSAMADNQLALAPQQIEQLVWRVAARIGVPDLPRDMPSAPGSEIAKWEAALAKALTANRGNGIVIAGGSMSAPTRALVHRMNAYLGNLGTTLLPVEPVDVSPQGHVDSIAALTADMRAGRVKELFILGGNPVYDVPPDLDFPAALRHVSTSVHLGLYRDETALHTSWHIPRAHNYEHWSDARAYDGTASIIQPTIAPLYGGKSEHWLLALLTTGNEQSDHALVQATWRKQGGANFDAFWNNALRQGVIPDSAGPAATVRAAAAIKPPAFAENGASTIVAVFMPDQTIGAGEFSNNAWLQELPKALTKVTWYNPAMLSIASARALGVRTGDIVRLALRGAPSTATEAAVWVLPHHADGAITLPLGYGRTAAGRVGDDIGFNSYRLRTTAALRGTAVLDVQKTGRSYLFASTQNHASMEGRDIVRHATLDEYRRNPHFANDAPSERTPDASLYPAWEYKGYKWGMAIDLNACIGCNACTIACQAENNIPVVGREEVIRGREMHWIRVDRYYAQSAKNTRTLFQPVPCMHCEDAPCEEVCPVGATVHDSEGLNVQVYNRCVGTRFCSNNCPYKVRRFNFFQYSNTDVESLKAVQNPEVTVRQRGVMEKCNYCLQRVSRARLEAEKLGRPIRDGEVVTACQAVCPTEAIIFGNLNDPDSRVNKAKASPLDYTLLAELNTRPRTTYAARVINPDKDLET